MHQWNCPSIQYRERFIDRLLTCRSGTEVLEQTQEPNVCGRESAFWRQPRTILRLNAFLGGKVHQFLPKGIPHVATGRGWGEWPQIIQILLLYSSVRWLTLEDAIAKNTPSIRCSCRAVLQLVGFQSPLGFHLKQRIKLGGRVSLRPSRSRCLLPLKLY